MNLIKPEKLQIGDTIAIIAPCGCVDIEKIYNAKKLFEKEGYKVNDYAQSILRELGDLEIRTTSNKNHLGVTLHFNPVNAASGEYDRM